MDSFHQQYSFDDHPSAMDAIIEYPHILPHDGAIDWLTDPLQTALDNTPSSHENALGLYEMYGHESAWSADPSTCPSITNIPQNDTYFLNHLFSHQPTSHDTAMHFGQPLFPYYAPVRMETTATRLWETAIPHSVQETYPIPKQIACLPGKHIGAPRLRTRSRHRPYPLSPDSTKRAALPPSLHRCRWFNGTSPCGAVIAGTKNAIARHLRVAHAIRLKADKTDQVCLWDRCQKSMRKESISRHILAVHMQDKVHCGRCRSQFARPDSLQRHQRTCLAEGEDSI